MSGRYTNFQESQQDLNSDFLDVENEIIDSLGSCSQQVLLRLCETQNDMLLPAFFFSFFWQPYPGLQNCKWVFLISKSRNMVDRSGEFSVFQCIDVRVDIRIDISISLRPYYDHQIQQAGTSTVFNSNETNQTGGGDAIVSRSPGKLKAYISTTSVPMASKPGSM